MTFVIELDKHFIWKPGWYTSRTMYRIWWGWFAVAVLRISFPELVVTSFDWKLPNGQRLRNTEEVRQAIKANSL